MMKTIGLERRFVVVMALSSALAGCGDDPERAGKEFMENAMEVAGEVSERTAEAVDQTKDFAEEHKLGEKAAEAFDKTVDAAETAGEDTKRFVEGAVEAASE